MADMAEIVGKHRRAATGRQAEAATVASTGRRLRLAPAGCAQAAPAAVNVTASPVNHYAAPTAAARRPGRPCRATRFDMAVPSTR